MGGFAEPRSTHLDDAGQKCSSGSPFYFQGCTDDTYFLDLVVLSRILSDCMWEVVCIACDISRK